MIHSFFLGIIEGLTEFLPISSTAHLLFFNYFLNLDLNNVNKVLIISTQLGAILAVVFYYFKKLLQRQILILLAIGVFPTLILGFLFANLAEKFFALSIFIAINLILGGIIILHAEKKYNLFLKNQSQDLIKDISRKRAFLIGIVQSIAIFPGVSRSGAIIVYGLYNKIERAVIAEYTFLLAVPTMFAATFYSILKYRKDILLENAYTNIFLAMFVAFLTALLVIKYALPFIKKYSFTPFAWYRILLGILLLLILFFE